MLRRRIQSFIDIFGHLTKNRKKFRPGTGMLVLQFQIESNMIRNLILAIRNDCYFVLIFIL